MKLRIAFGLALVVAGLTVAAGLVQDLRLPTVFYRAAISLIGSALAAYLAAYLVESYVRRRFAGIKTKGEKIDIISKDGIIENDELLNPTHAPPQFSPFVPDNFEQISVK